jgi:hypothetical protein
LNAELKKLGHFGGSGFENLLYQIQCRKRISELTGIQIFTFEVQTNAWELSTLGYILSYLIDCHLLIPVDCLEGVAHQALVSGECKCHCYHTAQQLINEFVDEC